MWITVLFFKDIGLPKELNLQTIMIIKCNKYGMLLLLSCFSRVRLGATP